MPALILKKNDDMVLKDRDWTDAPQVQFGRDAACDIIINKDFVSRRHLTIEFRNKEFILTDHSLNGSYIHEEGAPKPIYVHGGKTFLRGKGRISPGCDPQKTEAEIYAYERID